MDTSGSIRSSGKHGKAGFRPTSIEPALLATAKQFLESFLTTNQGFMDLRIRQHLHPDKAEQVLDKQTYYVLANEQKFEPGFLCIMKGHPIVFLQSRLQYGFSLRLRCHPSLYQKGAVFIGTMDTIQASLRLEDVWQLNGVSLLKEPFSKRYEQLSHFFKDLFVQDAKLSNCTLVPAEFHALSEVQELVESNSYASLDFLPEQGGRKRWNLPLTVPPSQSQPSKTPMKPATKPQPAPVQPPPPSTAKFTEAIARRVQGMPDTYSLTSKTNMDLGRAAVQTSGISILLRNEFTSKKIESVVVSIQWNEEFQRYKITGLVTSS
jgi:hypothetical protein